jgi:Domain of unknown function (DUF5615)
MKVLLDECIPRKLKNSLPGHECRTVQEIGCAGTKNGALLSIAESKGFDVFLTIDKGLEYEQNLTGRKIAVLLVRPKSNRLADLQTHAPACLECLRTIGIGQLIRIV